MTALPRVATDALVDFGRHSQVDHQEAGDMMQRVDRVRGLCAKLIGAGDDEIALLGPTALGLNMVADGISWDSGDEVVFYADDYPANVYPWRKLVSRGVKPVAMEVQPQGVITWPVVREHLSARTRLVSLATANFLTGYRVDVDAIGFELKKRGILFCVDGIQTLGAFPFSVEYVDFLSADSHKWMLGPMGAGLVFIRKEHFNLCPPTLLGSWNVVSPHFIAQENIAFYEGGRRYEPGSLNLPGILSMGASLELLLSLGVEAIAERIRHLRRCLIEGMRGAGWEYYFDGVEVEGEGSASGLVTFCVPEGCYPGLMRGLEEEKIRVSVRHDRAGKVYLRASPHFYNTEDEIDHLVCFCRCHAAKR